MTASASEITCSLNVAAAAGSWHVQVRDANGLTPHADGLTAIDVPLSVDTIDPATDLNQLGGDVLTITGNGFDQIIDNTSVVFSDGTTCDLQTSTATEITCMVSGFDKDQLDTDG